jgi:hypothetical protein
MRTYVQEEEEALLEQHDPEPVAVEEFPQHEEEAWLELLLLPQHEDDC